MADMKTTAKIVKQGQLLTDIESQAMAAIAGLKTLKTRIVDLKTTVQNDPDFTAEDAAAVQTVITSLLAEIDTI